MQCLRQELKPTVGAQQVSHQVLGALLLLATKQKNNAEAALQIFMDIASTDAYKDHVGAIFGMATAYMILKQVISYKGINNSHFIVVL